MYKCGYKPNTICLTNGAKIYKNIQSENICSVILISI